VTETEAQKVVTLLITAFPSMMARLDTNQQAETRRVYRLMIVDLDHAIAEKAVRGLIATSKYLPTIAEVREACMIVKYGRRRPGGDAWGDVIKAMKRYGYTRSPGTDFQFDDPLVARAVSALGWSDLCGSGNVVADRARFIELYDHLAGNTRSDAQVSPGVTSPQLESGEHRGEALPLRELVNPKALLERHSEGADH